MRSWLRWEPNQGDWISGRERVQVLFLSLPALYLFWRFWLQDAIDPLTAAGLLIDRGLQVASVLSVLAAFAIASARAPVAGRAAIVLSASGTVLGVSLLLTALVRPPSDLLVAALAGVVAVSSGVPLYKIGRRDPVLRTSPAKVAAGVLAAALPLAQFWNGVAFLPSRVESAFQEDITFETAPGDDGDAATVVDLLAKNDTDARLLVLTSRLTVCWWAEGTQPVYEDDELRDVENCRHHYPLNDLSWISPHSTLSWSTTVQTPPGDHRLVVISKVRFARGDRLRVDVPAVSEGQLDDCQDVRVFALEEESRLKGLAQQDKYLLYIDDDADGRFGMYFRAGEEVTCEGVDQEGLADYFGVTDFREKVELWIEDPPPDEPD